MADFPQAAGPAVLLAGLAGLAAGCAGVHELAAPALEAPAPAYAAADQRPGLCRGRHSSYTEKGRRYWVEDLPVGYTETGEASWYGAKFHGRKTASGEVFDMHRVSAAHRTLPLFSVVRVVNLENNKELAVRINDRGPFVPGRLIDLSYAAAKELGMVKAGVVPVRVIVAETPSAGRLRTALAE